ncbi:MAG: hypothetical protein GY864_09420 [Desulfobacterales bacterium]|nr:hypothetical protein [Desulfobacterales bacterium]
MDGPVYINRFFIVDEEQKTYQDVLVDGVELHVSDRFIFNISQNRGMDQVVL